jgi:hypothetical protein
VGGQIISTFLESYFAFFQRIFSTLSLFDILKFILKKKKKKKKRKKKEDKLRKMLGVLLIVFSCVLPDLRKT